MGLVMSLGVGSILMMLQRVPVDFTIEGTAPTPATIQAPVALAPPESPVVRGGKPRSPLHTGATIAVGFGRNVPLEFAVRQVAPRWVRVSYGESVDRQVRISWRGGRPWNLVLSGVLTPLGLHMTMSGRTLWIRD